MRNKFTLLFFAIIFFFLCLASSLTALAADGYTYIDENGDTQTTGSLAVTPITASTATLSSGWYVVNADVTRTGTITVNGDAKLILVDGKTLTVKAANDSKNAGISVVGGNSLTIYGQAGGTGVLKATGDDYGAGIGGRLYETHPTTGTITINGGTLEANGGTRGAGIGSGYGDTGWGTTGGTITINGGTVNATGGSGGGAGIGGGRASSGGIITINYGLVTATGGHNGAGIGGGDYCDGGNITINGGTIKSTSGEYGAGIGGGSGGAGGNITICGGSVTAASTDNPWGGTGIGGGFQGDGGNITISGGTIIAKGETCGAGIGGSGRGAGGVITISGGTVTATGDDSVWGGSAGIGCGPYTEAIGGTVTLSGGVVFAQAGPGAKDVGGGSNSTNHGTLEISNTAALFLKNNSCVPPTTTTHTNETVSRHYANYSAYGIPVPWSGNFGAYLRLYTLSYDANNGSGTAPSQVTQHIGTSVSVEYHGFLSRVGYTFSGWNTAANKEGRGYNYRDTFTFLDNTTLYAVWTPNPYRVYYNANGGTGSTASSRHTYDEAKTLTANGFARTGYTFSGWATQAGETVTYTNGQSVTNLSSTDGAEIMLYAIWRPNSYTVEYDANRGSGSTAPSSHTYDAAKTLTANGFTRVGYTFAGWATSAGGAAVYEDEKSVSNLASGDGAVVTLYAAWTPHTYTVNYDANGGTGSTDLSIHTYDAAKTLMANGFTRLGYSFAGWANDASGIAIYSDGQSVSNLASENGATVTLYAVWTPNSYIVSYDANGGLGSTAASSHTYDETTPLTANNFTKTGYTFAGWAAGEYGTIVYTDEAAVSNLASEDGSTVTLYAVWTPNSYTVSYNANGGSGRTASSSHTYDEAKRLTANGFARVGYTFAGWAASADGGIVYTDEDSVLNLAPENGAIVTLYAVWTPHTYMVSYDANGGTGRTASSSHTYDEAKPLTANGFTRVGYTFAGWATEADGGIVYTDEKSMVNLASEDGATVNLYAVWAPHTYTVSYNANGGTGSTAPGSHTYDAAAPLAANRFTKTGYTFAGWAASADGAIVYMDEESIFNLRSEDGATVTLYAVWRANSYTISYNANGGTGSTASSSHTYDEAKTLTANGFTRTGYTFVGWATSARGTAVYTHEEIVMNLASEDNTTVTLYVVWSPHTYKVSYNANGGSGSTAPSRHTYDAAKMLTPNSFTRTGYTFSGWAASADGALIYSDGQSISNLTSVNGATVTLYAVWTPVYSLSVTSGTGSGSYKAGTSVSITADAAPSGKAFDRWTSSGGGTFEDATTASTTFMMPDHDVTVTAAYKDAPVIPKPVSNATVTLKPLSIQTDERADIIIATINIDDLPEDTAAIQLPSGEIIHIDMNAGTFKLEISQDDLQEDGNLVILALDEEGTPLGNYSIDLSDDVWQPGAADSGNNIISVLVWIAAAALVIGVMSVVMVRRNKKAKRFPK